MDDVVQLVRESTSALIGRQLVEVRYYKIPFGLTQDRPWDWDLAHLVDYGVDLVTDQGTFGITWTPQEEVGYRIDCTTGPLLDRRSNEVQVSHVEESEPWSSLIGSVVQAVEVTEFFSTSFGKEWVSFPLALTITFTTGRTICLVSGSWHGDDKAIFPTGNDIVIIWKKESIPILLPFLADQIQL
jgi:hypothetical protein